MSELRRLRQGGSLAVHNFKGSIVIEPWEREEVKLEARVQAPAGLDADYAQHIVEVTRLHVEGDGDSVMVRSDHSRISPHPKPRWRRSGRTWTKTSKAVPDVTLNLSAPRSLSLSVRDFKSRITLGGFVGEFDLSLFKSTVTASGLTGCLRAQDHQGGLRVSEHRGPFEIQTFKGRVEVGIAELREDSRLQARDGQLVVRVPDGQGVSLLADLGRWSRVESDFGKIYARRPGSRALRAELNSGGPALRVNLQRGSLALRRC